MSWLRLNRLLTGLAAGLLALELVSRSPIVELVPTATCLVVFALAARRDRTQQAPRQDPPTEG